jgi:hypothetical protein
MEKILIYFLILLICGSCEEQITWDLDISNTPLLVVEGMITNENMQHQIKLTRPVSELNAIPEPVSGATVVIYEPENSMVLTEDKPGSGIYLTDSMRAVFGKVYALIITIGEKEYTAQTSMVPVTPLDSLEYSSADGTEGYYKLNLFDTDEPSMTEYYLDWSQLPGFTDTDSSRAKIIYYSLNTVDVGEMFKPEQEQVVFPEGTVVHRKKYSMNEAHADFIRTLLSETEWRGGLFDVQPGNVQTNLSNGAVGYFAASTVVTDSTVILPLE